MNLEGSAGCGDSGSHAVCGRSQTRGCLSAVGKPANRFALSDWQPEVSRRLQVNLRTLITSHLVFQDALVGCLGSQGTPGRAESGCPVLPTPTTHTLASVIPL